MLVSVRPVMPGTFWDQWDDCLAAFESAKLGGSTSCVEYHHLDFLQAQPIQMPDPMERVTWTG